MNRTLRLACALLLALALPLQGLAAATMIACGPLHQDAAAHAAHAAHEHPPAGHGTGGHGASALPAHDTHGHGAAPEAAHAHGHAMADDGPAMDADDPASTHASQKCSVCASCCTASAGLPTQALLAAPAALADARIDRARVAPAAFLTGGPERPPRSFLA